MTVTASCHLQVEGDVRNGEVVYGAKVVGFSLGPPGRPKPGTVCIKVNLRLPDAAFLRLIPEADVVVPDEWWTATPVVVVSVPPDMELEVDDANVVDQRINR